MQKKLLGAKGEKLAQKFLKKHKYKFLDKNYSCQYGEIDLIFQKEKTVIFVEVKTRFSTEYGQPEEAVTPRKIQSITNSANLFLLQNPKLPKAMQIDVISVLVDRNGDLKTINHFSNVTS